MTFPSKEVSVRMVDVEQLSSFIKLHYNLEHYDAREDQFWDDNTVHLIPVTGLPPNEYELSTLRDLKKYLKSGYTLFAIMADLGYRKIIPDNLYLVTCD